jgi:hypothetical protein
MPMPRGQMPPMHARNCRRWDGPEIRSLNHGLPRKDTFPHTMVASPGEPLGMRWDERQEMLQSDLQPSAISFNSAPWTHSWALVVVGINGETWTNHVCVCMHSCCIHSPCQFWHSFLFILHMSIYFPTFQNGAAKSTKTLKT